MSHPDNAGLLTPEQLSERWQGRIKPNTLAQWRTEGKGPAFTKIGNKVFYRLDSVIEWEKKQEK